MLLFVRARYSIGSKIFRRQNYPMHNHVGLRRVFNNRSHNYVGVACACPNLLLPIDPVNLSLNEASIL